LPTVQTQNVPSRDNVADPAASTLHGPPDKAASDLIKAQYSTARYNIQRDYYSGLYRFWSRSILFLLGKQWLLWNKTTKQWTPEKNVPKWRQQPVTNLVYRFYKNALAKLTKQRPAFDCVPPSGDADDRAAAELGNALLKFWWRLLKMPQFLQRSIGWMLSTGNAWAMVDWDPEAGVITPLKTAYTRKTGKKNDTTGEDEEETIEGVPADKDGDPILKDDGNPDMDAEPHKMAQGEISVQLISPFSVRMNPEAESVEDATEFYIGTIKPSAVFEKQWDIPPSTLPGVGNDEQVTIMDIISAASTGTTGVLGFFNGSDNSMAKGQRSMEIRYYAKPDDDYPEGRHWITVDGRMVLPEEELPNGFWPPMVVYQDLAPPGQAIAMGPVGQLTPIGEAYNTINGKIQENNVTMAMGGKWLLSPEDKSLAIDSDPGQKIVSKGYAAGKPPMQLEPKGLPEQVYQERERIMQDFQFVSGMSEVDLGGKPEGVSSGRGFLVLQEASDSTWGPTLQNQESFLEEVGRRMLVIAHRKYTEERTVKIGGENGVWQFRAFKGADLTDSMEVQVQSGSSFPWSRAARQDTAMSLISSLPGLVTNPQTGEVDVQKLGRLTDVGGLDAISREEDPDSDEIEREHAEFEDTKSEYPQIGIWQDHAKHLIGHGNFFKRDRARFDRMPKARQAAFIQHYQDTIQAIAEAVQQTMPNGPQGQMGGPPGGGAPQPQAGGPMQLNAPQPPMQAGPPSPSELTLTPADMRSAAT
jgi:hypothetical protein